MGESGGQAACGLHDSIGTRKHRGSKRGVEVCGSESADVFAIELLELGQVKDRAAEADVFHVKVLDHLWERELLCAIVDLVGHSAAHQAEKDVDGSARQSL
jgi:hypothetical protein